jgi:hypothetical protein
MFYTLSGMMKDHSLSLNIVVMVAICFLPLFPDNAPPESSGLQLQPHLQHVPYL